MKKVLIVTYHFPPDGGAAVQRVLKFVKYLLKFGYLPFVLTAKYAYKNPDITLLDEIPLNIQIFKTEDWGMKIPFEIRKIFKKYFSPDKQSLWKYTSIKKGIDIVQKENIDLIFSTSPPHSVHLVAKEISQSTKVPWIADFRDEWTMNSLFYKTKFQDYQHELENSVLLNCSAITTITHKAKSNFKIKCDESKIHVIKNGFDPEDFKDISSSKIRENKIVISYCGRLNKLHSPKPFFRMLKTLKSNGDIHSSFLSVNIIGSIENKKWLKNFQELDDIVQFIPYQTHKKCIEMMSQSSVLLLLATEMNITEFIPAKMFEYFYLKKAIYSIVSFPGELSNTLQQYGNSYIGYESDPDSIETSFNKLLYEGKNNNLEKPVSNEFMEQFNREILTKQLAEVFNFINEN